MLPPHCTVQPKEVDLPPTPLGSFPMDSALLFHGAQTVNPSHTHKSVGQIWKKLLRHLLLRNKRMTQTNFMGFVGAGDLPCIKIKQHLYNINKHKA